MAVLVQAVTFGSSNHSTRELVRAAPECEMGENITRRTVDCVANQACDTFGKSHRAAAISCAKDGG